MTEVKLKQEAEEYRLSKADCQYFSEPYKEKIERAYVAGAEPREKRIAELEAKLEKETVHRISNFNKGIEWKEKHRELKKENAELKCECSRCVYSDSPCVLSDYEKDNNGICSHFKNVFDEVAELKEQLGDKVMQKQKDKADLVWRLNEANEQKKGQLTKAKELLKQWLSLCGFKVEKLSKDTEQFLSEVK